ncbi:hypothetical protein ACTMTJ_09420 [Phytohabitans sp. LJ34]|uniref:hypothetical protein n=1 Tax=Phytohabitans sp. LJ34 TaxID=3452217 RepID=UPI003F8A2BD5
MAPTEGWPFLVGAGRRRDYSVLLAPDFMLADSTHGRLGEVVAPTPVDAPPRVIEVSTSTGHRLEIAYATYLVSAADVAQPRDEHGRPLRFMYGFVCRAGQIETPATADLDAARAASLATYRRYLAEEDNFRTAASTALPLRSTVTAWPVHDTRGRLVTIHRHRRSVLAWSAAAATICALATAAMLIARHDDEPAPHDRPTPSPSQVLVSSEPGVTHTYPH